MIRGYFSPVRDGRRPYIWVTVRFPTLANRGLGVELLVDTGAERTVLTATQAAALGLDLSTLPVGAPTTGIGGRVITQSIDAVVEIGSVSISLPILFLATFGRTAVNPPLLGRDILRHFALFLEERSERVLLLEPDEVTLLQLP
jgi:hypothetical protein